MNLEPLTRFEWERVVMAADLPPTTKLVALGLATFANRAGGNAHPGNKRLARELNVKERTVERHLETLRTLGLVERTFRGSAAGRKRMADVYRLVTADDLHERLGFVGSPDTGDVCMSVDHPSGETGDSASGSSDHPTRDADHPTPETGTPDFEDRSPVSRVDPTCMYITEAQHEDPSSSDATHQDDSPSPDLTTTDEEHCEELETIKKLPTAALERLLEEAQTAVGEQGWSAVVHYAATHMPEGAVA